MRFEGRIPAFQGIPFLRDDIESDCGRSAVA
jgi:hypothetical protein